MFGTGSFFSADVLRRQLRSSGAPNAGQRTAGQSDFSHFAIRTAPGENAENAENADLLSRHTKKRGLRKSRARKRGKCGKFGKYGRRKRRKCGKLRMIGLTMTGFRCCPGQALETLQ